MSALVMVVERPGAFRDALIHALAARGARTDTRDDAMEALAIVRELSPNVVLVSDQTGPPDPQSVCRVLQRKLGNAAVYRLGEPDFDDPLAKGARVLPRLADPDAVAAAVLDASSNAHVASNAIEWDTLLDVWQVPGVLLALHERRSTGYLLLQGTHVEREIAFVRGFPVAARGNALDERLGAVLLRAGAIAEPALLRARDTARTHKLRLGEALLADESIDPIGLYRGLALQLRDQLIGACEGGAAQARFLPQPELAHTAPLLPWHPLAIAYEVARRVPPEARETGLARLAGETLARGAHAGAADAWLRALGVPDLDPVLARAGDARGLVEALRGALAKPAEGETALEPSALVLALIWARRIEPRIASARPPSPSIPAGMPVPPGGWLRALGELRPVQLPAPMRPIAEAASDLERSVDAYLLREREQPLARRRALEGPLADIAGETPDLVRQWCRDLESAARGDTRANAAALRAALEGATPADADPLAARCRRALLRRRLEQITPADTRPERASDRSSMSPSRDSRPAPRRTGTSRAAPPPPPPPRSPAPEAPPPDDDQALFEEAEPLLHQGNWSGVVALLARDADAPSLSPRLNLLYAIALKEAHGSAERGKQNADADLVGMRAVSALLRVPAESPTALIVGKRVLRKRPIEWQNSPPRRVSLLLIAVALLVGAAVGVLFNQRLIDLIWK